MTRGLAVGLAGLGRMGRIHAENLAARCASAHLACVFDADPVVAAAVAERLDVPWTASYDELLDSLRRRRGRDQHRFARRARRRRRRRRGGTCSARSRSRSTGPRPSRPCDAAERAGIVFQVGFHRRFDPDWVAANERIQAGELGEVTLFRTSLRDMNPPDPAYLTGSGGFFVDVTVHDLDVARWMVGEVVEVTAHGAASDPAFAAIGDIDTAVVVLRFAGGALGVIDNSRSARYGYECSTEVMGSRATARIDAPHRRGYEWRTPGLASHDLPRDFEERYPQAYAAELEGFARCVLDGTAPRVTGLDALAAFDLAMAADVSWRTGRSVALTPRPTGTGVVYETAEVPA